MKDFAGFMQKALPQIEKVVMQIAEYNNVTKGPISDYFRCELVSYYPDGRVYETDHHSTWAGDMQDLIWDAQKNHWKIDYDAENKVFRFEKHFTSGMYRIATYTPYDKEALDLHVHED